MRIALITGSAEPGKDGIGDHARVLAAEMIRRGHTAWLLAINDSHIEEPQSSKSMVDGVEVTALRLPTAISNFRRFTLARAALDNADAEAVLYDFSPTQYDGRGLVWLLAKDMASLAWGRRKALLVHEYCLGSERGAGLKRRLWGRAQQWGFQRFARNLVGMRIAATNRLYGRMLERDGHAAEIVPLFSNVPVLAPPVQNWCHVMLAEAGTAPSGPRGFYCAGFFGSVYRGADLGMVLPMLQAAADSAGGRLALLSLGHLGEGEILWRRWQEQFGPGTATNVPFLTLGRREAGDVSAYINGLDLGLVSVPMTLAGKSSTLAAFIEHGLPSLMMNDSVAFDLMPDNAAALPPGALPPTAQTAALLARQPLLPRIRPEKTALAVAADWLERALRQAT